MAVTVMVTASDVSYVTDLLMMQSTAVTNDGHDGRRRRSTTASQISVKFDRRETELYAFG